jgi:hypothetical protein
LIEHLSSKHKLLSSNPVPQKKKEEEEKGRKEGRKYKLLSLKLAQSTTNLELKNDD